MSKIYIVAGPPGIGKSTYGQSFVPGDLEIIKKDEIIETNKAFHYKLYQEIAISKWLNSIKYKLDNYLDFAFELNLGKRQHYEYALAAKKTHPDNKLNVILFFTDDLEMCQERAAQRFKEGKHDVNPNVLEIMYRNSLPLLKENIHDIDELMLVDVSRNEKPQIIAGFVRNEGYLEFHDNQSEWLKEIMPVIRAELTIENHIQR